MKLLSPSRQYSLPVTIGGKKLLLGLLLVSSCLLTTFQPVQSQIALSVGSVISVFQLGKEVVSSIIETWDLVEEVGDFHLPFKRSKDEKILKRMHELSLQIEQSEHQVRSLNP